MMTTFMPVSRAIPRKPCSGPVIQKYVGADLNYLNLSFKKGQIEIRPSFMESQFRTVIRQKIIDAQAALLPVLTRRDVWLPSVKAKATAVIGVDGPARAACCGRFLLTAMQVASRARACFISALKTNASLTCRCAISTCSLKRSINSTPHGVIAAGPASFWMKSSSYQAGNHLPGACLTAKTSTFSFLVRPRVCCRVK